MRNVINRLGLYTKNQVQNIVDYMKEQGEKNEKIVADTFNKLTSDKNKEINNITLNSISKNNTLFILTKDEYKFMLKDDRRANELFALMKGIGTFKYPFIDKSNTVHTVEIEMEYFHLREGKLFTKMHITVCEPDTTNERGWLYFKINGGTCKIDTVEVIEKYKKKGIGSFMMKILEEISLGYNVNVIKAWLSQADKGRRYEQIPFYKKNGYTLMFNGQRDYTKEDTMKDGLAIKEI